MLTTVVRRVCVDDKMCRTLLVSAAALLLGFGSAAEAQPLKENVIDPPEHPWSTSINDLISRRVYSPSEEDFSNPDRGFYDWVELLDDNNQPSPDFSFVSEGNSSLAFAFVRLDQFRSSDISDAYLAALEEALGEVRESGFKLILRVAYNFPDRGQPQADATLSQINRHAAQLQPVLHRNADVISVVQAGMIGPWGEWHGSSPELATASARAEIKDAALRLTPPSRFVQLRAPKHLIELAPELGASDASVGEILSARLGHHNDCFLSSVDDVGTYFPARRADEYKAYLDQISRASPIGGETCGYKPSEQLTSCAETVRELQRFHWSFLNKRFYRPNVEKWKAQGCYSQISKRLGYRFELLEAQAYSRGEPGKPILFSMQIQNSGFARPYNPRDMFLVLKRANGATLNIDLSIRAHQLGDQEAHTVSSSLQSRLDVREMLPGAGENRTLTFAPRLPADISPGEYDVFLHLPDPLPAVAHRPEFAIRFANASIWRADTGQHDLGLSIEVTASATFEAAGE